MKWVVSFILAWASICVPEEVSNHHEVINDLRQNFSLSGILKADEGFVYVDIEDGFIYRFIDQSSKEGFDLPPYFGPGLVGAHITVIYPDELQQYGLKDFEGLGERIPFELKECQIVFPKSWEGVEQVFLVTVEAPILDEFREKYGLPKRKYDYHITLGVKLKNL